MTPVRRLSNKEARRISIAGQMLTSPRPRTIEEVVHGLTEVQLDPTSAVARTEHLVLWSRLGRRFKVAELERLLWTERRLFEYGVHIVPTSDFAIHREAMRRYPYGGSRGEAEYRRRIQRWLSDNASYRRYVLRQIRANGPTRARDLDDHNVAPWQSGGWNDNGVRPRSVALLLDLLWTKGEVMIVGRDGQQRLWDLAERSLPFDEPRLPQSEVARCIVERQLHARGVGNKRQFGWAVDGRPPGWERALEDLVREGVAVPVEIEGMGRGFYAHVDLLDAPFRGRTTLLSPFDDLVSDRNHTERLFGFWFRIEIYVPKAKRRYGYFVMPILHGDRLIGRVDPKFDRASGTLQINGVWAEAGAPAAAGTAVRRTIDDLAAWLGATDVAVSSTVPRVWSKVLRA